MNKSVSENSHQKEAGIIGRGRWATLGLSLLTVLVIFGVSEIVSSVLVALYPVSRHWNSTQANQWLTNSVYAQFAFTLLVEAIVVVLILLALKYYKTSLKSIGLKGYLTIRDIGYTLVGFGIYFAVFYIAATVAKGLVNLNVSQQQNIGFSTTTTGSDLWLVFASLVILPPIAEEILFRGFLYSCLRSKWNKIIAAVITSIVFATFHIFEGTNGQFLWIAGLDTFTLSLVLVWLRERTDKLWASMGLHMIKNFIAFAGLFLFHVT